MQLVALRIGLLQEGDVGVAIFPRREEVEEVLIRGTCFRRIALSSIGTGQAGRGKEARGKLATIGTVIDRCLEFRSSFFTLV